MELALTPERQELADSIRRFAAEQVTAERLAAWDRTAEGIDEAFWKSVVDLGWIGLGMPLSAGGSGLGLVDLAVLLAEASRGLVPLAVASAVRAADALALADPQAPELADLAAGRRRATLAIDEEQATEPDAFTCAIEGDRLKGRKWCVEHAAISDFFVVAARDGAGLSLVLTSRASASVEPLLGFAGGAGQGVVVFDRSPIARRLCHPREGEKVLREIRRRQTALALAEMVGGMDAVLEKTVAYVKEREQFGQKIAVFQAVQHQIADMATAYTAGRHLAWQAITRVAEGIDEPIDLPAAAAHLGAAFKQLTVTAHHLHGGAGFVVEHPLHYYSERAQSLCIRHTSEARALEEVAAVLLD